ncbi:flavin reductase [Halobacillus fulvus]|nr:flavin reductase [Halobacillus fulvus]
MGKMGRVHTIKMHSYPGMVAVVGVETSEGANFMAAGWHAYLSMDPPMYGVAVGRDRFTHSFIKENGAFSINFLPFESADFIQYSGTATGLKENKAEGMAWERTQSGAPLLSSAYLGYECTVDQVVATGDHDWVIGHIEKGFFEEDYFLPNGLPNFEKLHIPLYLGRSTYLKLDQEVKNEQILTSLNNKKS